GHQWLMASVKFDVDGQPWQIRGHLAQTSLASLSAWKKKSTQQREDVCKAALGAHGGDLLRYLGEAKEAVRNYLTTCAREGFEPNLRRLKTQWASGRMDLRTIIKSTSDSLAALHEQRKRQEMLSRISDALPLAQYPDTFVAASRKRKLIAVLGPTNSGKTHEAFLRLAQAQSGVYLGPLRLLALEAFQRLNSEFG